MREIERSNLPEWYFHYRSSMGAFRKFDQFLKPKTFPIPLGPNGQFWWGRKFFFSALSGARFEKIDTEPTAEVLREHGLHRCLVFWSGWSRTVCPAWWIRLPNPLAQWFNASKRSGFSEIRPGRPYFETWKKSSRNARKKAMEAERSGIVDIRPVTPSSFLDAYGNRGDRNQLSPFLSRAYEFIGNQNAENLRSYMAFKDGVPLAGAAFLDFPPTSLYWIAFLENEGRSLNLWTALIDRWFKDSQSLWMRFLDFGHLRSEEDPEDRQGYTDFKKRIAECDVRFDDVWFRFFP